jgi:lipopolysaccharide export system protein LptC
MTTAPLKLERRPDPPRELRAESPSIARAASLGLHSAHARFDMRIIRRRWMVAIAKRLLPVAALALLSLIALWPELTNDANRERMAYGRDGGMPQSGEMLDASYHGVDARNRPYTMTATTAHQISPERVNLTDPKGDMTLESGNWLMVDSRKGVYLQHAGNLDLSGDVHIYRDDGTTLTTDSAAIDLKAGAAAGAELVHAEGPFGTLDAQGFALTDKGGVIQFSGPGKLIMNASENGTAKPAAAQTPPAGAGQSGGTP